MTKTITFSDFVDEFHAYGRGDNFTYEGLKALYNWFEELEELTGQVTELDVIAICCEFDEADWQDVKNDYSLEGETPEEICDELSEHTLVVALLDDESIVYIRY